MTLKKKAPLLGGDPLPCEATLKGFDKPVRLFEVRWQDA